MNLTSGDLCGKNMHIITFLPLSSLNVTQNYLNRVSNESSWLKHLADISILTTILLQIMA